MAIFKGRQLLEQLQIKEEDFDREQHGLKFYNVRFHEKGEPKTDDNNAKDYRVCRLGSQDLSETRCVLLLGKTGAGKTWFLNAALNYLFGVEFDDPFRLQVKEKVEKDRKSWDSQTDRISVYIINYREGMKHKCNFVFIDTPGLDDTRGEQYQKLINVRLETFLSSEDADVKEFHCVGLVANATVNRYVESEKAVLKKIVSMLGDCVAENTCILATHATDEPLVDTIFREAGVSFKTMLLFDNGALKTTNEVAKNRDRWGTMIDQYTNFFRDLMNAAAVSNIILKEKTNYNKCKETLQRQIHDIVTSLADHAQNKQIFEKQEIETRKIEEMMKKIAVNNHAIISKIKCTKCKEEFQEEYKGECFEGSAKEMQKYCKDNSSKDTPDYTLELVKMVPFLGIPIAIADLLTKGKTVNQNTLNPNLNCAFGNCTHSLKDHTLEQQIIDKATTEDESKVYSKELHDEAASKKHEASEKMKNAIMKFEKSKEEASQEMVHLLHHAKKFQELISKKFVYIEDVMSHIRRNSYLSEFDISHSEVKLLPIVEEALKYLDQYTAKEVLGKDKVLLNMLPKIQ